jgi:hypothetical protein
VGLLSEGNMQGFTLGFSISILPLEIKLSKESG